MGETSDTILEAKETGSDELFKKRVAQFDYYYDNRTFSYKLRKSVKQKKEQKTKYAIVIRRQIDSRGRYRSTVLDIKSTDLCSVLLDINKGVEDLELSRAEPTATEALMYYSYPGLLQRLTVEQAKEERNEPLICDIQAGIFYVEQYLGKELKDVEQMVSQREISWDTAWALFFPNSLVYSYHSLTGQQMVLIVRRSEYETHRDDTRYLEVTCDIIDDDGLEFGFAERVFEIDEYSGTRPIATLPVFPLRYHNDSESIYARAVEFGKRFVQLSTHSFHEITGRAFTYLPTPDGPKAEQIFVDGRVMISPSAHVRFCSTASAFPAVHQTLTKDSLTDDQYAICTPVLRGFAFDRKTWGGFSLACLRDVNWNETAFDALVLGEKQKKLIHSLVRQHVKKGTGFDDIIKGKGLGLIGLLAGTPGCGKTLTAEAVAEVTHRPLYVLSAGELGTTPDSVEQKLSSVLELAQMWDAVLLLDEAEVFLTPRNAIDLQRNALVAIFLRQLEYYQGILILTTNMPEQCDHAFESRIHFSVNYPELDFASRKIIWAMFFKRGSIDISDEELCHLALHPINGRQIKNAFSSALTISHANDSLPSTILKDIDVVLSVLNDWQKATRRGPAADVVDLL
ncbi:p-loop containing nucleoside triphosphate hydrolase protein [Mycena venus]|uniref:p-loop containing nucleoside triphosphate hydrolase protein n=1 Tax=Mycena venus TaxID=2733690 RepID=A0A8H6XBS0_9AGAR|nr:p-loop containing nucleoside triphosphate hydrolase protein [Mycena venus]